MIVELNNTLSKPAPIVYNDHVREKGFDSTIHQCAGALSDWNTELNGGVQLRYNEPSRYEVIYEERVQDDAMIGKGFLSHMSKAYSQHFKIAVNPQDFWFIVMCELAAVVGKNPSTYQNIFTHSAEKQTILVPTGSFHLPVELVVEQLRSLIPVGVDLFLPAFSTATRDSDLAIACALLHTVKHYYNYSMFCCGLPAVKVNGSKADWQLFNGNVSKLKILFVDTGVEAYLAQVEALINELITATFDSSVETTKTFWESVFSKNNIGSGGQATLSGWIAQLYTKRDDVKVENFEKSLAVVPYDLKESGEKFLMIVGGFMATADFDGFYTTQYSKVVARAKKM